MTITGEAMIKLAHASGAPQDARAEGVVRWATDKIREIKSQLDGANERNRENAAENERLRTELHASLETTKRLRDLCTEWASAADAACSNDHRPSVLKERLAVLTEQAGRSADQLGEISKLKDALKNLLDFVDSRTSEDDTEPHLAVDEARELLE